MVLLSSSLCRLRDVVVDVVSDAGAASACRDRDEDATREVVNLNFFPMNVIAILYWMSYRSNYWPAGYGGVHRTSSLSLSL